MKTCNKCKIFNDLGKFKLKLRMDTGKYKNSCLGCDKAYFASVIPIYSRYGQKII